MLRIRSSNGAQGLNGPAQARLTAGRRVCRKYRRAYIRKLQQQEYDKLRSMVPSLAGKLRKRQRVSKIKVIEATIAYIDQLHHALAERLQGGGVTKVKDEQVARAAKHLFVETKTRTTTPPGAENLRSTIVCEKDRRFPSYLLQSDALSRHVE